MTASPDARPDGPDRIAAEVDTLLSHMCEALLDMAQSAGSTLVSARLGSQREALRTLALDALAAVPLLDGAGFATAHPAVRQEATVDAPVAPGRTAASGDEAEVSTLDREIEWWMRDHTPGAPRERTVRREFDLDAGSDGFYAFDRMDWYTIPVRTGQVHLAGPYIDYLGVDEYILTLTVPLRAHDEIVGIAGFDITQGDLEGPLTPLLRRTASSLALVSGQGRVLLGNSAAMLPGDSVRALPTARPLRELAAFDLTLWTADEAVRPRP
ncbi:MAG: hypothetical protein ACFWTS_06350 [Pseudoclavibacter caeni]